MYLIDKKNERLYGYVIHNVFPFNVKYILNSLNIFAIINVFKSHFYVKYQYVCIVHMCIILTGDAYL